jgi:hypothetical protein
MGVEWLLYSGVSRVQLVLLPCSQGFVRKASRVRSTGRTVSGAMFVPGLTTAAMCTE